MFLSYTPRCSTWIETLGNRRHWESGGRGFTQTNTHKTDSSIRQSGARPKEFDPYIQDSMEFLSALLQENCMTTLTVPHLFSSKWAARFSIESYWTGLIFIDIVYIVCIIVLLFCARAPPKWSATTATCEWSAEWICRDASEGRRGHMRHCSLSAFEESLGKFGYRLVPGVLGKFVSDGGWFLFHLIRTWLYATRKFSTQGIALIKCSKRHPWPLICLCFPNSKEARISTK